MGKSGGSMTDAEGQRKVDSRQVNRLELAELDADLYKLCIFIFHFLY